MQSVEKRVDEMASGRITTEGPMSRRQSVELSWTCGCQADRAEHPSGVRALGMRNYARRGQYFCGQVLSHMWLGSHTD